MRLSLYELSLQSFSLICHTLPPSVSVDGLLGLDFLRGQRLNLRPQRQDQGIFLVVR